MNLAGLEPTVFGFAIFRFKNRSPTPQPSGILLVLTWLDWVEERGDILGQRSDFVEFGGGDVAIGYYVEVWEREKEGTGVGMQMEKGKTLRERANGAAGLRNNGTVRSKDHTHLIQIPSYWKHPVTSNETQAKALGGFCHGGRK